MNYWQRLLAVWRKLLGDQQPDAETAAVLADIEKKANANAPEPKDEPAPKNDLMAC